MKYQIKDIFSDFLTSGAIFTLLSTVQGGSEIPWDVDPSVLDLDYIGNHSGDKLVSPLICKMLEADGGTLSIVHKSQLAVIIYNKYINNWIKRYTAFNAEYNPLENYSMVENETVDGTNTGTQATAETVDRDTSAQTDTEATGSIYGYDSSTPSPSDKQESSVTSSGTEDVARNNTRTDNLAHSEDRELTRAGNIGVTTSQQMLQAELDIRMYDFFESVYNDIDKVLAIPVY